MYISVITPTYNRAYTLERLFLSLESQSSYNFEWILIDDGSIDNTKDLVESLSENSNFNIRYYYQNNCGKPSAINKGVSVAEGEYVFIVDSDDKLVSNSIETLIKDIQDIDLKDIKSSGLCYRKGTLDGELLGPKLLINGLNLMTATELKNKYNVDLAYCFKREFISKFPFPTLNNEKFVPELFIWNKITDVEKVVVYSDKIIYLCEFLDDGLTLNFNNQLRNNPNGFLLYYKDQFFRESNYLNKLKMAMRYLQCLIYKNGKLF